MILTVANKKDEKFLRRPAATFNFSRHSQKEIRELIKGMREIMRRADGVGLSANQLGLDMRVFVAAVNNKFYAIFNPEIIKKSEEKKIMEEGCLSVPGLSGQLERSQTLVIQGFDPAGKKIKIKAWGLLARVFQHEVDHLNGVLFVDKAGDLHKIPK